MHYILSLIFLLQYSWSQLITPQDFENNKSQHKVLVFVSDVCPCSQSHLSHLNQLAKQYPQIPIFAVISEKVSAEHKKESDEYFSEKNFKFPVINDPKQSLVKKYNALKTPHATILANTGKELKVIYQGGVTNGSEFTSSTIHYLEENLKTLTNSGSNVEALKYKNGLSLGCYISRSNHD